MITFHPTISLFRYLAILFTPAAESHLIQRLERLFPHHATILTDSGRSALALAIESLSLEGKVVALPAFLCDVFLPILECYRITPVFLDIDDKTFQPPMSAYTPSVLKKIDAVVLVATYGGPISEEIISLLKKHRKIVIEDYAHRKLPKSAETLQGDARCYSLPKILPVTNGGIAVLPEHLKQKSNMRRYRLTLASTKNWLKLFKVPNIIIAWLKYILRTRATATDTSTKALWDGVRTPSRTTIRMLHHALLESHNREDRGWEPPWQYCAPLRAPSVQSAKHALFRHGIIAERLWYDPIVTHPRTRKLWSVRESDYPHTHTAACEIVCVPLWHIRSEDSYERYMEHLENTLADERAE